jgi:hypothetical protein
MIRLAVSAFACCLVLVAFGARDARAIAQSAWDQAKVTAIAKELVDATVAAQDTINKEPFTSAQSTNYYRLKQHARRIRNEARELHSMLQNGEGHDQTVGVYENLLSEIERTRVTASNVHVTSNVTERVRAAREVLERLAPYYDTRPLGPPLAP